MNKHTLIELRKAFNPISVGWAMLRGFCIPTLYAILFVFSISALLIIAGLDPMDITVAFLRDAVIVLSPLVAKLLGAWILYTYLYLFILCSLTFLTNKPEAITQARLWSAETLFRVKSDVVRICFHILTFSSRRITTFFRTNPLRESVQNGPPKHLAIGWTPSINPQIE